LHVPSLTLPLVVACSFLHILPCYLFVLSHLVLSLRTFLNVHVVTPSPLLFHYSLLALCQLVFPLFISFWQVKKLGASIFFDMFFFFLLFKFWNELFCVSFLLCYEKINLSFLSFFHFCFIFVCFLQL
jgi:hypothetical protein